jgi:quercetin dioxygenase-like cupin family protein
MEESMKQGVTFLGALVIAGAAYAVGFAQGSAPLTSAVVPMSKTTIADSGAWGAFHKHLSGPTAATADVLSGVVELKAGSEPHPPHQHVDEEFLYVLEGSGTWFLNGKEIPAKTGDVLYTAPNDIHGIRAGAAPLRFFVAKWRTK